MIKINKIFWKRTYLFIEYSSDAPVDIFLKNQDSGRKVLLESRLLNSNYYRAKLNVTIANGRDLLEAGSWDIVSDASDEPVECSSCILSDPFIGQRIFRYTSRFYSYTFRLKTCGNSVIIINRHYMSVKKEADEKSFVENFFS